MTTRIIGFILFPCLIIALVLSLAGVEQVAFGDTYYNFMKSVNRSYQSWTFEIPKIPYIPSITYGSFDTSGFILSVLIKIGNFFVTMINALVSIVNILVTIVNVVIKLIQFFLTLIWSLLKFRDSLSVVYL